jgi:transposase
MAKAMGIINTIYKKSTLNKYMKDGKLTKYLHQLVQTIAEPLKDIEIYGSVDATGISNAYGRERWVNIRRTKKEKKSTRSYSKLHVMVGFKTGVITSVRVTTGNKNDSPYFKPLLDDTAKVFNLREISADAGYISRKNVKAAFNAGAAPFIMPRKGIHVPTVGTISPWIAMLRLWKYYQPEIAEHYHRRSKVESVFSAKKRKFGDFCRCKLVETQENEILCRVICYNAAVLSKALLTFDLKSGFIADL